MRLIAHRGASGYAPENTKVAFRIALEMGAPAMELDIRETSDTRIVVLHDESLKRTAGLRALIGEVPYSQVANLEAGAWFDKRFAGERVPLLEHVLEMAKGKAEMHVEVKGGKPGMERRLLDLLRRTGFLPGAVVSSFHPEILKKLRELDKRVRLGYLVAGGPLSLPNKAVSEAKGLRCESVHLSLNQANARWVRAVKDHGMTALVYTVNKAEELTRLEKLGVEGVFTNYPDLLSRHWAAVGGTNGDKAES
jgi:glycerophosphoryl diester phosphodiesterase